MMIHIFPETRLGPRPRCPRPSDLVRAVEDSVCARQQPRSPGDGNAERLLWERDTLAGLPKPPKPSPIPETNLQPFVSIRGTRDIIH